MIGSSILAFLAPFVAFRHAKEAPSGAAAPAPETIDGFIAWLETKDPNERYNYLDASECLFAQYGMAMGWGEGDSLHRPYQMATFILTANCPIKSGRREPFDFVAVASPQTFGGALKRARKFKRKHNL